MPPGRKAPAQTYLPPHLRRSGAAAVAPQGPRSLEEVAPDRLQILVRYSDGGPFSMEGCPDPVADDTEGAQASAPPGTRQVLLNTPPCPDDYDRQQLLNWFAAASSACGGPDYPDGDYRACLVFPAAMTKAERAAWHDAAGRCRLKSQSQGVGAGRHLTIAAKAAAPAPPQQADQDHTASAAAEGERAADVLNGDTNSGAAGRADDAPAPTNQDSSSRRRSRGAHRNNSSSGGGGAEAAGSKAPLPRWKRVWLWCQMEGQFEHSQGEVKELLASDAPLPPALQEVIHRRDALDQLMAALAAGDAAAAVALVQQHPKLAWTRHDITEDYPAHLAAAQGQGEVLAALLAAGNNVLEQKNRQRDTPVMVAAACGTLKQLEPVFEQQGDSYQRQRAALARLGRCQPRAAAAAADGGVHEGPGSGAGWRSSRDEHDQQSRHTAGAGAVNRSAACRGEGHTASKALPAQATAEEKSTCSWLERRRAFAAAQQQQQQQQQQETGP